MISVNLDSIDRNLISLVQTAFPLTVEPYADLGLKLGLGGDEVIRRIDQLKAKDIIRQISPVLDARSLGYQTTLVAMRVVESQLDKAAQVIIEHPGVSHGYERDHHFNFWFTLAIPPTADKETELQKLTGSIKAEAAFTLPAIKLFKIRAYFAVDGDGASMAEAGIQSGGILPQKAVLSRADKLVINGLQQDLPLVSRPFTAISVRLGMDVEDILACCRSLKQRGVVRRFAAAINHKQAGFKANAMACWKASPDMVDVAGRKLASLKEVSHCYERKTNPLWWYNLFAVIHGHTREECQEVASKISVETGLRDYVLLFSTKEFKKVRVKYLV